MFLWHPFCFLKSIDMKVAIPIFGNRISPRFDFSPEIWIIEVERGEVVSQGKVTNG